MVAVASVLPEAGTNLGRLNAYLVQNPVNLGDLERVNLRLEGYTLQIQRVTLGYELTLRHAQHSSCYMDNCTIVRVGLSGQEYGEPIELTNGQGECCFTVGTYTFRIKI